MHIFDSTAENCFGFCIDDDPPKSKNSLHIHKDKNAQWAIGPLNFMTFNINIEWENKTVRVRKEMLKESQTGVALHCAWITIHNFPNIGGEYYVAEIFCPNSIFHSLKHNRMYQRKTLLRLSWNR